MKKMVTLFVILGLSSLLMADVSAKCAGCHGANGEKAALGGKSKVINTMTKAEIKDSLLGYQAGTYGGAMKGMMEAQVKSLSEADIEALANKFGK